MFVMAFSYLIYFMLQNELKAQREELRRQKEALQKQMDLFEEQKSQFLKTMASSQAELASKVSPAQTRERSESPASSGGGSLERAHKRTSSNDVYYRPSGGSREGSPFEGTPPSQDNNNKIKTRSNSSGSTGKSTLPLHLVSATNEVKSSHVVQRLPLKLAGSSSSTSVKSAGSTPGGFKQVLPLKLSSGPGANSPKQPLTHTKSQPALQTAGVYKKTSVGSHNNTTATSNLLPMKLAEKSQQHKVKNTGSTSSGAKSTPPQSGDKKEPNQILYL